MYVREYVLGVRCVGVGQTVFNSLHASIRATGFMYSTAFERQSPKRRMVMGILFLFLISLSLPPLPPLPPPSPPLPSLPSVPSSLGSHEDPLAEMHLLPEPLFTLPSDNIGMVSVEGTPGGRIFLAGQDGCLHEVVYQADDGWFHRKCRRVNHSTSVLSYFMPSFLSFSEQGERGRCRVCACVRACVCMCMCGTPLLSLL